MSDKNTSVPVMDFVSQPAKMPELNLLRAVLLRAIQDFVEAVDDYNGAGEWIFEDENYVLVGRHDPDTPFSFCWVCRHLDLCPEAVRRSLRRFKRRSSESPHLNRASFYSRVMSLYDKAG